MTVAIAMVVGSIHGSWRVTSTSGLTLVVVLMRGHEIVAG